MGLRDQVYAASPYPVRDLLVTLMGYKFARERYSGKYAEFRRKYAALDREPPESQKARQDQMLAELVRHAASFSPYFRELYRNVALPERVEDIARLPRLEKDSMRKNLERMRTGPLERSLVSIHTSGTTGTPMEFHFTRNDFQERMAILDNWRAWFGVDHGMRRATFSGRVLIPPHARARRYWQTNWALKQRLYSSYHLSQDNLPSYIENLNRFQPAFLDGYPSALHIVARYLLARGERFTFRPKVAFATAETLTAQCREDVEAAFGCPLRDQYASSEGAPFIVECERGRYHFLTYSGVMEVVDENDQPALEGRVLFTAFHTRYMPLIRYDIGDSVALANGPACECGRPYPEVRRIIGREEDYLVSSTRGKVGRLDPIFKKIPASIVRSQIVQRVVDEIEVNYIPDPAVFELAHLKAVETELIGRLGSQARIQFNEVSEIPLGARGKFKAVVCHLE